MHCIPHMLGNRVATTDALGNTVYKALDPFGNLISEWGATYPVRYTRLHARRLTSSYNMPKRTSEMLGVGLVEVWVLLKNGLLFDVILSFGFLSRGDRPFGKELQVITHPTLAGGGYEIFT